MIADIPFNSIKTGDFAQLSKTIAEADVYTFAGVCGDFNPLHVDAEYAKGTPFKQRVAHGMLSASLISAVLGTALPGKNTIYLEQSLKFTAPVFIGDTITAKAEVTEIITEKKLLRLKTEVFNQEGKMVITGEAMVMKRS